MNGVTDNCIVPRSSHTFVPEGLVIAEPEGLIAKVTKYWVFQSANAILGLLTMKVLEAEEFPEASPLQPIKTYCVPVGPATIIGVTIAFAEAQESYHPVPLTIP